MRSAPRDLTGPEAVNAVLQVRNAVSAIARAGAGRDATAAERSASTPRIDEHVIDLRVAGERGEVHGNLSGAA